MNRTVLQQYSAVNVTIYYCNYGQIDDFQGSTVSQGKTVSLFGRPLGQAYAIGNPSVRLSVRL